MNLEQSKLTINCRTFVLMETKVETTNNDGKALAYEGEKKRQCHSHVPSTQV